MMTTLRTTAFVSSMLFAAGCTGVGGPESAQDEELDVSRHDAAVIEGHFDAGDRVVAFRAEMSRNLTGIASLTVSGQTLVAIADASAGEITIDASNASLSASDRDAIGSLATALESYMGRVEDLDAMHTSVLFAASQYFANAPVGAPIGAISQYVIGVDKNVSYSTGDDGKRCIQRGTSQTAVYDGSQGTRTETWVVGANGGQYSYGDWSCMGRCGVGCGSYDWTLDCLEHDACGRYYHSSGGATDSNCGDEFLNASDDYIAFWKRCRS